MASTSSSSTASSSTGRSRSVICQIDEVTGVVQLSSGAIARLGTVFVSADGMQTRQPLTTSEVERAVAELRASSEHLLRAASLMRSAVWSADGGRPSVLERRLVRLATMTNIVIQQLEQQAMSSSVVVAGPSYRC